MAGPRTPHVIFLFADQLRYDALACNGNRIVRTPNIDRVAREGLACDQAFASAPICGPYRGQLLTGTYPHTNGVICNEYRLFDDQRTIAHHFGANGYRTAYVGKWHLGYGPYYAHKRHGFDDLYAYNCSHNYYDVSYWHNEDGPFEMVEYAPRRETALAIDYLRTHASEQTPVFLMLSWGPPHWNRLNKARRYGDYPQEYNRYEPHSIEVSDNVPVPLRPFVREEFADYYGMVTSLDDCVGELTRALDTLGLADDTILCFSSDHGDLLGSHGYLTPADHWLAPEYRLSKASPYAEACRVPFVVRWPRAIPAGRRTDALISSADVLPTLAGLTGLSGVACQGTDLSSVFLGDDPVGPESCYLGVLAPGWPDRVYPGAMWRAVRTRESLYARWHEPADRRLLIDLTKDPLEMRDLSGTRDSAALERRMDELLHDWIARLGDPFLSGRRMPETRVLDVGQAFVTRTWERFAHPELARLSARNAAAFRTGEQDDDPIKPSTVGW